MSEQLNGFERLMFDGYTTWKEKAATRVAADTTYACWLWWETYGADVKPTAADLLTMVGLILELDRRYAEEGYPDP